jgi:hypothetical protein
LILKIVCLITLCISFMLEDAADRDFCPIIYCTCPHCIIGSTRSFLWPGGGGGFFVVLLWSFIGIIFCLFVHLYQSPSSTPTFICPLVSFPHVFPWSPVTLTHWILIVWLVNFLQLLCYNVHNGRATPLSLYKQEKIIFHTIFCLKVTFFRRFIW